jgi:hypothetical protein
VLRYEDTSGVATLADAVGAHDRLETLLLRDNMLQDHAAPLLAKARRPARPERSLARLRARLPLRTCRHCCRLPTLLPLADACRCSHYCCLFATADTCQPLWLVQALADNDSLRVLDLRCPPPPFNPPSGSAPLLPPLLHQLRGAPQDPRLAATNTHASSANFIGTSGLLQLARFFFAAELREADLSRNPLTRLMRPARGLDRGDLLPEPLCGLHGEAPALHSRCRVAGRPGEDDEVDYAARVGSVNAAPESFDVVVAHGHQLSGVHAFSQALAGNEHLQRLDLEATALRDDGATAVFRGLHAHPALRQLSLADTELTAGCAVACAAMLASNTSLLSLDLSRNDIRDQVLPIVDVRYRTAAEANRRPPRAERSL